MSDSFRPHGLIFPILLFSSISFHVHLKKLSYLSLLFSGTLHSDGYIFLFLLYLSLVFSPQTAILPFVFFFLGDGFDHHLLYNVTNLHP